MIAETIKEEKIEESECALGKNTCIFMMAGVLKGKINTPNAAIG